MATFTPVLRTDKINTKGRAPIYLRVIAGQDVAYVSLGVRIRPRDWNEQKEVRKGEPEAVEADGFVLPLLDGYDVSTPAKRRSAVSARNAYANKVLKKLAERAGVTRPERVTTHVARHSLAAHLLEAGVGAHGIKEVLKHSSVTTTERYLQGFSRDLLDAAYLKAFGDGGEDPPAGS